MGGRDHSIQCDVCGVWHGGFTGAECDCVDPPWRANLAACIHAAAVEEMRVRAALDRARAEWPEQFRERVSLIDQFLAGIPEDDTPTPPLSQEFVDALFTEDDQ